MRQLNKKEQRERVVLFYNRVDRGVEMLYNVVKVIYVI